VSKILLDTDVIIEILRKNVLVTNSVKKLHREGQIICYSPIAKAEIYCGIRPKEEIPTARLFMTMQCLPIDEKIGEKAGHYLKTYHKSHNLELGDALIAATANCLKTVLYTLNRKHFPMKDIKLYSL